MMSHQRPHREYVLEVRSPHRFFAKKVVFTGEKALSQADGGTTAYRLESPIEKVLVNSLKIPKIYWVVIRYTFFIRYQRNNGR